MNTPDLQALKERQREAWSSGDYALIGTTLALTGELLAEACDLRYDEKVLDVAAGNGNATLAAARRGCVVTSTDYVAGLLERGRERVRAEHFDVTFLEADAEALPYEDASFDAVLSTFGVMFTPDQPRAAAQLSRVCRPGGRIGLTCWTPDGFIGQMFKVLGRYAPLPPGVASPLMWGVESHLQTLFDANASRIDVTARMFSFRYRSPEHFVDIFRRWYGPVHKAFARLEEDQANALQGELTELISSRNQAGPDSLVVPSEYLEVVIHRA